MFRVQIRSRHPSHSVLRERDAMIRLPFRSVVRFGSLTELRDTVANGGRRIELNTTSAIKNSSNKLKMKTCFEDKEVKTADWWIYNIDEGIFNTPDDLGQVMADLPFPIISKHIFGSRGTGNVKHDTLEELQAWMEGKDLSRYIFEKFYNYVREYRLHVNKDGCFYACRKMLKADAPADKRWFRNDQHCVWVLEENENFDKPVNWDDIVAEGVKALQAVGLDFGAIDLRIQSSTKKNGNLRENPEFIVIEINSAPSFGDITAVKYKQMIPQLLINKHDENK